MAAQSFQYSYRGEDRTWTLRTDREKQPNLAADVQYDNRVGLHNDDEVDAVIQKWTTKHLMRLLRLYRAHSCLWDTRDPDNRSRKSRKAALIDIAAALGDTTNCVQRIRKGMGAKTKLKWFALAHSFLKNLYPPDHEGNEGVEIHSGLEHSVLLTVDPETDNKYIQSEHDDIKMEPEEEGRKSTSSNDYSMNNLASIIKTEENSMKCEYDMVVNLNNSENIATDNDSIKSAALSQHITQIPPTKLPTDGQSISHASYTDPQTSPIFPTKLVIDGLEDNPLEGKWPLAHSVKFLRLYGAHRCLWDLTDPQYRSREFRNAALEDIAAAMGYGLNTDYVAKKIKIFRITYMQHRKRMIEDIKENREPDVKLRWFPLADSFLRPHIGLRSIKNQERELPQFDFQYVYTNLNLIDPDLLSDFTIDCC